MVYAIRENAKAAVQVRAACGGRYEKAIQDIRIKLRHQRCRVRRSKPLGLSSPTQIICVSFVIVIALGTLLLAAAHCQPATGGCGVIDAMFTATSATCVTGLVVRDTWTQFTMVRAGGGPAADPGGRPGPGDPDQLFCAGHAAPHGLPGSAACWARASRQTATPRPKSVLKIVVGLAALL